MYTKYIKIIFTLFLFCCCIATTSFAQCCDDDETDCEGQPGGCDPPDNDVLEVPVIASSDPNDITGNSGYGDEHWVSINDQLNYLVRFENDPDFATAPALAVFITVPLDSNANIFDFRLGDFGFGDFNFQVPPNSSYYSAQLDVSDSLGVYVDVSAGINILERTAFWNFQSIDPNTGLAPSDPLAGFLPVNDSLTHNGEGYVNFNIKALSTLITGDSIKEEAIIIFDENEEIGTNIWKNLIDAFPPESNIVPGPLTTDTNFVWLNWSGQDDPGGVGVSFYDLYVSKNGDPYYIFEENIDSTAFHFVGELDADYCFYTRATDWVGNEEGPKEDSDYCVRLGVHDSIEVISPVLNDIYCGEDVMLIEWTTVDIDLVDIYLSVDGGTNYTLIDQMQSTANTPYPWDVPIDIESNNCYIKITDAPLSTFEAISGRFSIGQPDSLYVYATSCDPDDVGSSSSLYSNELGCDSTVITVTNFAESDTTSIADTSCDPNQVGVNTDLYANAAGCDSLVITTTSFAQVDTTNIASLTCDSVLVGVFENLYTAADGCDSLVIETVALDAPDTLTLYATTCDSLAGGITTTTLSNQLGCDSIVTLVTTYVPVNITGMMSDTTICQGETLQFDIMGGLTFMWTPTVGLSDSTIANPVATPMQTTAYTVTSWFGDDCFDYDTVTVTVNEVIPASIELVEDTLYASTAASYQWYFGGQLLVGATDPFYIPTETGNYSVVTTNGNGCTSTSVMEFVTVGTTELDLHNLSILPNPANAYINIKLETLVPLDDFKIQLIDLSGKVLLEFGQDRLINRFETMIHVDAYPAGMYVLLLQSKDKVHYEKIVVARR